MLGFQQSEIEDIEKSCESRGESCFSMLKQWFDAKEEPPSFEDISNVLSHVEVGRDDLAYKYCTGKGIQYLAISSNLLRSTTKSLSLCVSLSVIYLTIIP